MNILRAILHNDHLCYSRFSSSYPKHILETLQKGHKLKKKMTCLIMHYVDLTAAPVEQ